MGKISETAEYILFYLYGIPVVHVAWGEGFFPVLEITFLLSYCGFLLFTNRKPKCRVYPVIYIISAAGYVWLRYLDRSCLDAFCHEDIAGGLTEGAFTVLKFGIIWTILSWIRKADIQKKWWQKARNWLYIIVLGVSFHTVLILEYVIPKKSVLEYQILYHIFLKFIPEFWYPDCYGRM